MSGYQGLMVGKGVNIDKEDFWSEQNSSVS